MPGQTFVYHTDHHIDNDDGWLDREMALVVQYSCWPFDNAGRSGSCPSMARRLSWCLHCIVTCQDRLRLAFRLPSLLDDMRLDVAISLLLSCVSSVAALYEQCGGEGYTGPTTCNAGGCCTYSNPYYSQCLPCASTPSPSKTSSTPKASPTTTTSVPSVTPPGGPSISSTTPPSTTVTGPTPTGSQIRADQDPVFHFYLQNNNGIAVLGPESSGGYYNINGAIQQSGGGPYLNIDSGTASYRQLTFNSTATFSGWTLEGDTIITGQTSTYGRQLNFLVCETSNTNIWTVFLQLGNDVPPGLTCSNDISLHLPCLC